MKAFPSIAVQILLAVLITVISVLGISSLIDLNVLEGRERNTLQEKGTLTAERLADSLAYPLWNLNREETERVVMHEIASADVFRVRVFDENGELYIGKVRGTGGEIRNFDPNANTTSVPQPSLYSYSRPISFKDTGIGRVEVDVSDASLRSELRKLRWGIALKLFLVAVLLSLVLFVALRLLIIRPLSTLKSWVETIRLGEAAQPPSFKRSSEINSLAETFGRMSVNLQKKNDELESDRETLHRLNTQIRDLYNNAPCGYHSLDENGMYVQINDTELTWLGLTREEVIGKLSFGDVLTAEGRETFRKGYPKFLAAGSIRDVEYELVCKDGSTRSVLLSASAAKDAAGNYVMSRSTLYDITERKLAESYANQLAYSLSKMREAVIVSDLDYRFIYWNEGAEKLFGWSSAEAMGKTAQQLFPEDPTDDLVGIRRTVLATGEWNGELRASDKNGRQFFIESSWTLVRNTAGQPDAIISIATDITERKEAEIALRASEERFAQIFNLSPYRMGIVRIRDGMILDVNETWVREMGYLREEIVNHSITESPWLDDETRDKLQLRLKEGKSFYGLEVLVRSRNGEERVVLGSAELIIRDGEPCFIWAANDITERKRAEEAVFVSEQKFAKAFRSSPVGIGVTRVSDGQYLDVNDTLTKALGFRRDELIGRSTLELNLWQDPAERERFFAELAREGTLRDLETEFRTREGKVIIAQCSAEVIEIGGEPCVLSVILDITERKRAEEAVRISEEKFAKAFRSSPVAISVTNLATAKFHEVNEAMEKFIGYSRDELIGRSTMELGLWQSEDDRRQLIEELSRVGSVRDRELTFRTKQGKWVLCQFSAELIEVGGEKLLLSALADITDRRHAEQENRQLIHDLGERVKELTAIHRTARILQDETKSVPQLLQEIVVLLPPAWQYPEVTAGRISFDAIEFRTPNFIQTPWSLVAKFMAGGVRGAIEVVYLEERPKEDEGVFLAEERNLINSLAEMISSALNQKYAEEALRESERRFSETLTNIDMIAVMADLRGEITFCNDYLLRLTGWKREEVIGRNWYETFLPEHEKQKVTGILRDVEPTGEVTLHMENEIKTRAGGRRLVKWTNTTLRGLDGGVIGLAALGDDITERKQAEIALKTSEEQLRALSAKMQSAREEEGTRIAREIHDELGSALTGLKWDLEKMGTAVSESENGPAVAAVPKQVRTMTSQIEAIINTVRRISSELRPGVLDDLGLIAAIEWHAQQIQERTGIEYHWDTELETVDLKRETSTAVFRIFQEVLTNVLRHSGANKIEVALRKSNGHLELRVKDNGRGITEREKRNTRSLGLLGMKERALLVGGEVSIVGEKGQGTTVIVRVPAVSEVDKFYA